MTIGMHTTSTDNSDVVVSFKKNENPYTSVPHMHSRYEIYYNICGAKAFMCDGALYPCAGHDLIVVPKFCSHKVFVDKSFDYKRCIISVDEAVIDMISMLCQSEDSLSWLTDGNGSNFFACRLSDDDHLKFMDYANEYIQANKLDDKLQSLACFVKILSFFRKCFSKNSISRLDDYNILSPVERAMIFIEQKFKTITLSDVCGAVYFSEDHLNRLFKSEMGMTIKQYIVIRKLTESKKYLYLGKSAKEACFLSGFKDYSNFRRTFKNYEGYNPGNLDELTSPI